MTVLAGINDLLLSTGLALGSILFFSAVLVALSFASHRRQRRRALNDALVKRPRVGVDAHWADSFDWDFPKRGV